MKTEELVIVSGKGGTGKTTVSASLITETEHVIAVDCDVEASNLHILLRHKEHASGPLTGMDVPVINKDVCIECGRCMRFCRWNAITEFRVIEEKCEGCGVCSFVCPTTPKAITEHPRDVGTWHEGTLPNGRFIHANMHPGGENSGLIVADLRKRAHEGAGKDGNERIITDGPPGIGCTVSSTLTGADAALIVIEPTISGVHDAKRLLTLIQKFRAKAYLCINKCDIHQEGAEELARFAQGAGIPVVGRIPYDLTVTEALVAGVPVVAWKEGASPAARAIAKMRGALFHELGWK